MDAGLTLLAHLVPRLTSQVEDAATEALAFILNNSAACRRALGRLLQGGDFEPKTICWVGTQITYEDGSRPDVVGYDKNGAPRVLVEAKFWAGLTDRQPNAYLANLPPDGPAILLFIVPTVRLESLWSEVSRRAAEEYMLVPNSGSGNLRRAAIEDSKRHLMMTGWRYILGTLHEAAVSGGEKETEFEIAQLQGLADNMEMDTDAFLPLNAGELEPDIPRRMLALMRLVDESVERVQAKGSVSGLRDYVPSGGGYGKSFHLNGVQV